MRAQWDLQNLSKSNMQGELRGQNIFVAYDPATPLQINSFAMRGDASKIRIDTADLKWSEMPLKLSGTIQPEPDNRLGLDLDIAADAVDLDHLIQVLKTKPSDEATPSGPEIRLFSGNGKYPLQDRPVDFRRFHLGVLCMPISA